MVSINLIAFELAAGIGKQLGGKIALDWMNKMELTKPIMSAFGGLETGVAGVLLFSLFNKSDFFDKIVPYACIVLVVLKIIELTLQHKANEPFAAMVGPLFVLALVIAFYLLRQSIY